MLVKVSQVLEELGVPDRPMPTQRVCDLYDNLRKDIVCLLSLRKMVDKSRSEVEALRSQCEQLEAPKQSASSGKGSHMGGASSGGSSSGKGSEKGSKRKGGGAQGSGQKAKRPKK